MNPTVHTLNQLLQQQGDLLQPSQVLHHLHQIRDEWLRLAPPPTLPPPPPPLLSHYLSYQHTCTLLLTTIFRDWVGCFSALETVQSFDVFFHPRHIHVNLSFTALLHFVMAKHHRAHLDPTHAQDMSSTLEEGHTVPWQATTPLEHYQCTVKCVQFLTSFIVEHRVVGEVFYALLVEHRKSNGGGNNHGDGGARRSSSSSSSSSSSDRRARALATWRHVWNVPNAIFNVLKRDTPTWLGHSSYNALVCEQFMLGCVMQWLMEEDREEEGEGAGEQEIVGVLSEWVTLACRVGSAETMACGWCTMLARIELLPTTTKASGAVGRRRARTQEKHGLLLRAMPIDIVETILVVILKQNTTGQRTGSNHGVNTESNKDVAAVAVAWFAAAVHWCPSLSTATATAATTVATGNDALCCARERYMPLHAVFTRRLLLHYEFASIELVIAGLQLVTATPPPSTTSTATTATGTSQEEEQREQDHIIVMLSGVWCDPEFVMSTNYTRHHYISML